MQLLVVISDTLTLCRPYNGSRALTVGDLVPVLPNGLQGRVVSIEDDEATFAVPTHRHNAQTLLDAGYAVYKPSPPLLVRRECVAGGEHFSIAWHMTRRVFEFADGTHCRAKFLRGWRSDKHPGVVVCEFKRLGANINAK